MKQSEETLPNQEKEYNKWKSRRWLITLWSMLMVTIIVVLGTIYQTDSFSVLATTLVAVPVGYVTLTTINKGKQELNNNDK